MTETHSSLIRLLHNRWAIPTLAAFERLAGAAKLVTIQHAISGNRDSLRRTFLTLGEQGFVERYPGYGHPLRPEYCLTKRGERIASICQMLVDLSSKYGVLDIAYKKWTLPTLLSLSESGGRFNEVRRQLTNITPRALGKALQDLSAHGLVERILVDGNPPRTEYRLTGNGESLAKAVKLLNERLTFELD